MESVTHKCRQLPFSFRLTSSKMWLLYLDESGNEDDPADKYFVLGGAALFERSTFFLSKDLDDAKTRRFPNTPPIEFHASAIRKGKGFWRDVPREVREGALQDVSDSICRVHPKNIALFAVVIEKSASLYGEEAVKRAVEEVCSRFELLLKRLYHENDDVQRGLLIFSEGRFDQRAKSWIRGFREAGTRWGLLNNFSDIPYFASTAESRLLQAADFIAYATYLLYERRDASLFRQIVGCFDQDEEGVLHGLRHCRPPGASSPCDCPACYSRRMPGQRGPWLAAS